MPHKLNVAIRYELAKRTTGATAINAQIANGQRCGTISSPLLVNTQTCSNKNRVASLSNFRFRLPPQWSNGWAMDE